LLTGELNFTLKVGETLLGRKPYKKIETFGKPDAPRLKSGAEGSIGHKIIAQNQLCLVFTPTKAGKIEVS
jgi:hypothetical protein